MLKNLDNQLILIEVLMVGLAITFLISLLN